MSWQATDHVTRRSRLRGSARLLLMVIAGHAHDDGTGAWPSQGQLARETGLTRRTIQRLLPRLIESGELARTGVRETGVAVYAIAGMLSGEQLALPLAVDGRAKIVPLARARKRAQASQMSWGGATSMSQGGATSMSHEPSVEPSVETIKVPRAAASGASLERDARAEGRAMLREARAVWVRGRRAANLSRFTDPRALGALRTAVGRALQEGVEWRDVALALERKAADPKANPWYADQWAREARYEREQAETMDRAMRARADEDRALRAEREGLHKPRYEAPGA